MTEKTQYDVFLSHNSADKPAVEAIARRLRELAQLEPFLDKWHLVPGEPWQEALEDAIDASRSCAVFLGPAGMGSWENEEMRAALDIRVKQPAFRVIPVLLPGASLPERGRLPRFLSRLTWVDFRPGLDDPDAFHRLVCGIQGIAPGPEGVSEAEAAAVCPFRGLQVFDEEHAPFFFGREALTQHLVEQLRDDRFLAVIGPSGSGKSSLVRAGLLPQVRAGALPASDRWPVVLFKPGPHPVETLAARLLPHLGESTDPLTARQSLLDALAQDERGLHATVQVALASDPDSLRLLLVVDQFEELFTLCRDEQGRANFIANLLYASAIAGGQTVAVVTMRADFFGKCAAHPDLAARLAERDVLVGPMSQEELRRAMEGPAEAVGLHYEKGLVETILDDLGDEPGALPLLQHTLLELWERRRGGWLTADVYHEIGGVRGALAQRADEVYDGLTQEQQAAARRVLLRLTQPGEGTEDTRRRASLVELLPAEGEATDIETAVHELADARLLTTGEDERGAEIVDVAHEALIRGWPRLQGWIDEDRAALLIHRRLTETAQEWQQNDRDGSYLYRGARLAEAEEWAKSHAGDLNPLEREFLRSSTTAHRRTQVRNVVIGVVAALLVAGSAITFAILQKQVAVEQQHRADDQATAVVVVGRERDAAQAAEATAQFNADARATAVVVADTQRAEAKRQADIALSRQLAAQSARELDTGNYEVALLLAIEAGRAAETAEAYTVLRQTFVHPGRTLLILSGHTDWVHQAVWNSDESRILTASSDGTARVWDAQTGAELLTLSGHTAVWNADESRILTASSGNTAQVWDAQTGAELLTLSGHTRWINQAVWSNDGSRILTASDDGTAQVWDTQTGTELVILSGHTDDVEQVMWNSDESRVLTASHDGTARVWDAQTGAELVTLSGHTDWVEQAVWNSDEGRILTASADGTARVWDAQTGAELLTLSGHTDVVNQAIWNGDESRILTAGSDGTARVWDAQSGIELVTLAGHMGTVNQAVWNGDESRILTASWDGTARVWDAQPGTELVTLSGHISSVLQAVWNSDESRILTASSDGTARVWDVKTGAELATLYGHTDSISQAVWNGDESRILTASDDGTARVWDAETGAELVTLSGHTDWVWQAVWNSDESRILTASKDGTARVWDAQTGAELVTLSGHTDSVFQAVWSSDGSRILTESADDTARVWDAQTGAELFTLSGHTGWINQAVWNGDESRILTTSYDGTARVWDAQTGTELVTLSGHTDIVYQAVWNSDESRILTVSEDSTARVWDAETGAELVTLSGHTGWVRQAAWNEDESRILTASVDGTVRQWYARMEDFLEAACQRAPRNMSEEEWQQYMVDQPYRETCPGKPVPGRDY